LLTLAQERIDCLFAIDSYLLISILINKMSALLDFFDANKKCPDIISNCVELRKKYFETYNTLTAANCKQCDIVNLKKLYLAKIKFSSSPISYKKNVNKKDSSEDILIKEFIFLYPFKLALNVFKNNVQIISFREGKQRVTSISKNYIFLNFKNMFLFIFLSKSDYLLYIWYSINTKTMRASIYNFYYKYILKKV
jgi:hypothetical protein